MRITIETSHRIRTIEISWETIKRIINRFRKPVEMICKDCGKELYIPRVEMEQYKNGAICSNCFMHKFAGRARDELNLLAVIPRK